MKHRFIKEFARYTQAQIIGGFDGLTEEQKNSRIASINNCLANYERGLITVEETMLSILHVGGTV